VRRSHDDIFPAVRRLQRGQKRLADGSLGGATNLASPVASVPVGAPSPKVVVPDTAGGGPSVAWLNSANGVTVEMSGLLYMEWDQLATHGDTSWFLFPASDPYFRTRLEILKPGIFTAFVFAADGPVDLGVYVYGGPAFNQIAGGFGGSPSLAGSFVLFEEQFDVGYQSVSVVVEGASDVNGQLCVVWYPGEPGYTSYEE
jgi:hypothetical protein